MTGDWVHQSLLTTHQNCKARSMLCGFGFQYSWRLMLRLSRSPMRIIFTVREEPP